MSMTQTDSSGYSPQTYRGPTSATAASGRVRNIGKLTARLRAYFEAAERVQAQSGFPANNVLSRHWMRGTGGHRVLIRDLPPHHVQTGWAIRQLPPKHQSVIIAKYGWNLDERSRLMTDADRAKVLGITAKAFEGRLTRARRSLRRLIT